MINLKSVFALVALITVSWVGHTAHHEPVKTGSKVERWLPKEETLKDPNKLALELSSKFVGRLEFWSGDSRLLLNPSFSSLVEHTAAINGVINTREFPVPVDPFGAAWTTLSHALNKPQAIPQEPDHSQERLEDIAKDLLAVANREVSDLGNFAKATLDKYFYKTTEILPNESPCNDNNLQATHDLRSILEEIGINELPKDMEDLVNVGRYLILSMYPEEGWECQLNQNRIAIKNNGFTHFTYLSPEQIELLKSTTPADDHFFRLYVALGEIK